MSKQVLFIQGAGENAYREDAKLVRSLHRTLGSEYEIIYPTMPNEADVHYGEWRLQIETELAKIHKPAILIGHSVGGSILLKCLSEIKIRKPVAALFLMATPFWGGDGWRYDGYEDIELSKDLVAKLAKDMPLFFYHCRDDSIVPYEHLALYKKLLPHATSRNIDIGGHQFNDDLVLIVQDIHELTFH
ncbi:MAG: Alpha/beta hydrolase family [Candidatus Saccharibacteria bacterium]|nr:Alpha/beta hydrolase family [Candidatus Saccharibacteria bacterium]